MCEKRVYTVSDVQTMLGVGKNQAYKLIKEEVFPTKKIGRRIVIPIKQFESWLETTTK